MHSALFLNAKASHVVLPEEKKSAPFTLPCVFFHPPAPPLSGLTPSPLLLLTGPQCTSLPLTKKKKKREENKQEEKVLVRPLLTFRRASSLDF